MKFAFGIQMFAVITFGIQLLGVRQSESNAWSDNVRYSVVGSDDSQNQMFGVMTFAFGIQMFAVMTLGVQLLGVTTVRIKCLERRHSEFKCLE